MLMNNFDEMKEILNQYLNDNSIDPETKIRIIKRLLNNKCQKCGYHDIIDGIEFKFYIVERIRTCQKCFI